MADEGMDDMLGEIREHERSAQELQEQIRVMQMELETLTLTLGVLGDMDNASKGSLFSVGSGVYVKAKVSDTKNIILDLGGGIVVEKTVEEAKQIVAGRIDEQTETLRKASDEFSNVMGKLQELNEKIHSVMDQYKE